MSIIERKTIAILDILSESQSPLGARILARALEDRGIDLSERTVRYHLLHMDMAGLTENVGRCGRIITETGLRELERALAQDRLGMVIAKIDELSYQMNFDLQKGEGDVLLNLTFIKSDDLSDVLSSMLLAFNERICLSNRIAVFESGEEISGRIVPEGKLGIGTVCSVTINAILIKSGIPVSSRFGGLLELRNMNPVRFAHIINYSGSTLDPIEIFIKSGMTSVRDASTTGSGMICASFRDIPSASLTETNDLIYEMKRVGLDGMIKTGKPNSDLLGIHVGRGRAGLVVTGGLNPIACAEEAGIATESIAMISYGSYESLLEIGEAVKKYGRI